MFDRHRIRRWRIGHEDAARAAHPGRSCAATTASRYVPERTIVAIVGDVDPDQALALAREAYGDWPAATGAVDPSPEEPERREVRARTLRGDVSQAELVARLARGAAAASRRARAGPGGGGARLRAGAAGSTARCASPGIVTWVAAHNYAPTELGVFSIAAELAPERRAEARRAAIAEIGRPAHAARAPRPTSSSARARCSARAGRAGSSPWRVGPARSPPPRRWTDVGLLDREYAALAGSTAGRRARGRGALSPAGRGGRRGSTSRRDEGSDLTAGRSGARLRGHRAPRRRRPRRSPRVQPAPRPVGRTGARPETVSASPELPGADLLVRRKTGVPLVTLGHLRAPPASSTRRRRRGSGRSLVRAAVRGAGELDAAALAFAFERLGGTLAHQLGLRLARLRRLGAGGAPGARRPRCWTPFSSIPTWREADVARRAWADDRRGRAGGGRHVPLSVPARVLGGVRRAGLRSAGRRACPRPCRPSRAADVRAWHRAGAARRPAGGDRRGRRGPGRARRTSWPAIFGSRPRDRRPAELSEPDCMARGTTAASRRHGW